MANLSQSPEDNSVRGKGEAVLQTICATKPRESGYMIETRSIKVKRPDANTSSLMNSGAPERIRTSGLCLRRAALYPAELQVLTIAAV